MIGSIRSLDRILKGEATRPAVLRAGTIEIPVGGVTVLLVMLASLYGACMGAYAVVSRWGGPMIRDGWLQLFYSAAKVPMLFFLTLAITFPSLYVFNALVGCRLAFAAVLRLLVAALGVTLAVLASFGTIIVFFSLCSSSYPFIVLLNVAIFAVSGILGMNFLLRTLHRLAVAQAMSELDPSPTLQPPAIPVKPGALDPLKGHALGPHVRTVFAVWVIVFGLIGSQMGWMLRPFIGAPNVKVTFFRQRQGSFFDAVWERAADLTGEWSSSHTRNPPSTQPVRTNGGWDR